MSIPDFQAIMLPLLKLLEDGKERTRQECVQNLADQFHLTAEERAQRLQGGQPVFTNRVSWARTYLKKAGLLETPRRGTVRITARGKGVLAENPSRINTSFLMQFEEFREFGSRRRSDQGPPDEGGQENEEERSGNPVEQIERSFSEFQTALAGELLEEVRRVTPASFERLVVQLLVKMGYGGELRQDAAVVGGSGDEGIDGIINEDKLGLDVIYIQAKQWANPVGRPEVQKFAGALQGKRAKKGVFITTSSFTREAREFAERLDSKIILIDGERLARLMIEHNVGVTVKAVYELKSIDRDFFEEMS